jgi:predicted NBD/HSP70 family sugar kinase
MPTNTDRRIVMTLDAGGTNFVFSAIQANQEIVSPITLPANAHDLNLCLKTIVDGFSQVETALPERPAAIIFTFPGPADHPAGIARKSWTPIVFPHNGCQCFFFSFDVSLRFYCGAVIVI